MTERHEALASRADFEAILKQVADGITVQDADGALVYANDAAAMLAGFGSAAEFLAAPIAEVMRRFEMIDEDGNPFPIERLPGRLALQGVASEQVIRYRETATGRERWSIVRATPIFDEEGRVRYAVNAFQDVTPSKEIEERLEFLSDAGRALNATLDYESTLETLGRLVVPRLAEWSGFYLVEEGLARRMFGAHRDVSRRELVEETARRFPFDLNDPQHPISRALYAGEASLFEHVGDEQLRAASSSEEHFAAMKELGFTTAMVVPLETSGRVIGAMTLVRTGDGPPYTSSDLLLAEELARRAAVAIENARNYSRAQERAVAAQALEFVGDGVFLVDAEGIVRLWNPAAEAITGLTADDVVGRPALEAVPALSRIGDHVHPGGRPETLPVEIGERELWLSISAVEFPGGTVFGFRDVTDERALDRLKNEFVSTVSHELRTPLAAIYGAAMTIRREEPGIRERQEELLDVIAVESERLRRTVNDVLWASRLETGGVSLRIESCDAAELIDSVAAAARIHLPPNLRIEVERANGLPRVAADPDRVRQVLANLLDNAVKYSPDGGTIHLQLKHVGRFLRFVVRDEGLGIPAGERERIFEKFYRLDPNLTRGVGGTGLGLYISRELVRRMDGRVLLEPNDARGSAFAVELPIASQPS